MKTSLGDTGTTATFYVDTEPGDLGMSEAHAFEVEVSLRALAPLYRAALRSISRRATLRAPGRVAGTELAIVVRVIR